MCGLEQLFGLFAGTAGGQDELVDHHLLPEGRVHLEAGKENNGETHGSPHSATSFENYAPRRRAWRTLWMTSAYKLETERKEWGYGRARLAPTEGTRLPFLFTTRLILSLAGISTFGTYPDALPGIERRYIQKTQSKNVKLRNVTPLHKCTFICFQWILFTW